MKNTTVTKIVICLTYIYLVLPFLIFSIGWMKKQYWILIVPIVLFCTWKAWKDTPALWAPELTKRNLQKAAAIILIISVWVVLSGIGRLSFQNTDHIYRNGIFETLVNYEWPIRNENVYAANFPQGTTATSLIYYIGFWLPSAVAGKIFGIRIGFYFQAVWAAVGIGLAYYFICVRKKKILVWPLGFLILFSGMDIVGQYLNGADAFLLFSNAHLEWWQESYQYSSMTTQLFWVFNQAVPAWLCTAFLMVQKNNRSMVMLFGLCMLSSTFPFTGLIPFVLYWMFSRDYRIMGGEESKARGKEYLLYWLKDTFTVQNILGGGVIGIFSFLYLTANSSSRKIMETGTKEASLGNPILCYVLFFVLEAGIYLFLLYKYYKKDALYYIIFSSLLLIPVIKVGSGSDFCMRASIPALFLLMVFAIDGLDKAKEQGNKVIYWGLIIVFCIGSVTPLHEISRSVCESARSRYHNEPISGLSIEAEELLNQPNFSGSVDKSFFFRYIAD